MSSRWYPIYSKGNPQLRIFLPNLFMKLVKPEQKSPKNIVTFHVSMQMTKTDVMNYLKKIYNVNPVRVHTRIKLGEIKKNVRTGVMVKKDDTKIAYVYLPKDQEFEYPNIFESEAKHKEDEIRESNLKNLKEDQQKFQEKHAGSQGVPGWFNI